MYFRKMCYAPMGGGKSLRFQWFEGIKNVTHKCVTPKKAVDNLSEIDEKKKKLEELRARRDKAYKLPEKELREWRPLLNQIEKEIAELEADLSEGSLTKEMDDLLCIAVLSAAIVEEVYSRLIKKDPELQVMRTKAIASAITRFFLTGNGEFLEGAREENRLFISEFYRDIKASEEVQLVLEDFEIQKG